MKNKLLLLAIFALALFCRLYQINRLPPSLNWDEVSLGYNAYSIFKTGRDEWGSFMPLIFRAFGDYKLPLYIYLTAPIVGFFGLNTLTTKLISILAGAILPIIIYQISALFSPKNKTLPLIGSFIFAIAPWHIFLSRIALEANLFLTLFAISLYFLLKKRYALSTIFYSLCLFTYNSSRALLPFYLLLLVFLIIKNKYNFKRYCLLFLPIVLAAGIFLFQTFQPSGQARYGWVTLIDQGAINKIDEARNLSRLPSVVNKLINNRPVYFIEHFAQNYFGHFNPQFLFFTGGNQYQFSLPNFYLLNPFLIIFWLWGIFILIKNIKQPPFLILLFLFLASPVPSSITRESPHVLRSLTFIALSQIIILLPLIDIKANFGKILNVIFTVIAILSLWQFIPKYQVYAVDYSSSWQFGYDQAVNFLKTNYSQYDHIYFTKKYGEAHEFVNFFWPIDPHTYQTSPTKLWDYHANWYWVNGYDKITFVNDWEIKDLKISPKSLLITSPNNYPLLNSKIINIINYPNQQPVFNIIEYH